MFTAELLLKALEVVYPLVIVCVPSVMFIEIILGGNPSIPVKRPKPESIVTLKADSEPCVELYKLIVQF